MYFPARFKLTIFHRKSSFLGLTFPNNFKVLGMTETGEGWTEPVPGGSSSLTLQQPKKHSRQLFRKSRTEVKAKNDNSWCQNVVFCGRRRQKRVLSQFVDVELSKSTELQNTECNKNIDELNNVIAIFRENLIHIAKPVDCPEIRDKIKETRKKCLDLCVATSDIIMPQIRSDVAEGIPVDSQQLVNLVCCTQLFLRELRKCHCLVKTNPMDLRPLYEKRPRSSGMSVLDKLVLFKLQPRDYHKEELQSIVRDTEQIATLLREMKEFMPCESNDKAFIDENLHRWNKRARRSVCQFAEDWICYCGTSIG